MSYFCYFNSCKFPNCTKMFPSQHDLIVHIEEKHINFDPKVMDDFAIQKMQYVPMSYIQKYCNHEMVKIKEEITTEVSTYKSKSNNKKDYDLSRVIKQELLDSSFPDLASDEYYPSASYYPEISVKVEASNAYKQPEPLKKYSCPINGCTKRYKNMNGMKYHVQNFHSTSSTKPKKEFKCNCGREYKTLRGLQSHELSHIKSYMPQLPPFNTILPSKNKAQYPVHGQVYPPPDTSGVDINIKKEGLSYSTLSKSAFADVESKRSDAAPPYYHEMEALPEKMYARSIYNEYNLEKSMRDYDPYKK